MGDSSFLCERNSRDASSPSCTTNRLPGPRSSLSRWRVSYQTIKWPSLGGPGGPVLRDFEPRPPLPPGSPVRLRAARHPLIDPATVVPIDLEMTPAVYALGVTGPNTGGKTGTPKT